MKNSRGWWRGAVSVAFALAVTTTTSVARADEEVERPTVAPEDPGAPPIDVETMNPERPARLEERVREGEEVRNRGGVVWTRSILETRVRCEVPCSVALRRPLDVRVSGDGVAATDWFTLQSDVRRLVIWPGSAPARTAGLVLGGVGILATVVAVIATPFLVATQSLDAVPYGVAFWGVAIALVAPGAGLYFANATRVRDDLGRSY